MQSLVRIFRIGKRTAGDVPVRAGAASEAVEGRQGLEREGDAGEGRQGRGREGDTGAEMGGAC
jgi:hypothetical protein